MRRAAPWDGVPSLDAAFAQVETVARRHGFDQNPRPTLTTDEIASSETVIGVILPDDLRRFLTWYNAELWSFFVNPARNTLTDCGPIVTHEGVKIEPGSAEDRISDLVRIHAPGRGDLVRIGAKNQCRYFYVSMFLDNLAELGRAIDWSGARFVIFGSSLYGEPIGYCLDRTDSSAGAIIAFNQDTEDRMWLADSLAEWLSRLACCDGTEYAFAPGSISDLPAPVRKPFIRRFLERNPRSSFFSG